MAAYHLVDASQQDSYYELMTKHTAPNPPVFVIFIFAAEQNKPLLQKAFKEALIQISVFCLELNQVNQMS